MSLSFDPNKAAPQGSGIFGLPHGENDAALVLIPVPWEVTTSYGGGTSLGPSAILAASHQLDLFDLELGRVYAPGIALLAESEDIRRLNSSAKEEAREIIEVGGDIEGAAALAATLARVNGAGKALNEHVRAATMKQLHSGKLCGIVGGDHSVPFGAYQAVAAHHGSFGILHLDAHSDTREAYEGFTWSHASIMRNALDHIPALTKLVQVGIRDFCEEEHQYLAQQGTRTRVFWDLDVAERKCSGEPFRAIAKDIIASLPERVWISIDIDGLDPTYCPNTGTPVPGGQSFHEVVVLLGELGRSGRTVLGFDLVEVAPHPEGADEWDANVGMRLLYKLCGWTLATNGRIKPLR